MFLFLRDSTDTQIVELHFPSSHMMLLPGALPVTLKAFLHTSVHQLALLFVLCVHLNVRGG